MALSLLPLILSGVIGDIENLSLSVEALDQESSSPEESRLVPSGAEGLEQKVREIVESLPVRQREFIWLYYYQGLSYRESALKLGVSAKSAEKLHAAVKQALRVKLSSL